MNIIPFFDLLKAIEINQDEKCGEQSHQRLRSAKLSCHFYR
jgi:hypothetical protein